MANVDSVSKNASIFGTGKPRDINKPEIRELEERLEKTLAIASSPPSSSQQPHEQEQEEEPSSPIN